MGSETNFEDTDVERLYDMARVVKEKQVAAYRIIDEEFDELTDEPKLIAKKLIVDLLIAEAIKEATDSGLIKKQ